ncbi:MAG: hypothetical protein LBJ61_10075 [Deltaproteobacteria bacterium]|jgi:hypothetical protein|nr:hypothetical protein [Deltaproteobacteria bacterium]
MSQIVQFVDRSRETQVSFWDIFKNARTVLWEKPKPLMLILATLTVLTIIFEQLGNHLLGPFNDLIFNAINGQYTGKEFLDELDKMVAEHGSNRLIFGKAVPWLLSPLVNLALARVALNLWDGYRIGQSDILFSLGKFPPALYVTVLCAILGLFVFALFFVAGLPMIIIHTLAFGGGLPGPLFLIFSTFGFVATLFLIAKYVWPILRRFFFLQFMAFFAIGEGQTGDWTHGLFALFRKLKAFPRQLNQAVITALVVLMGLNLILFVLAAILSAIGLPYPAVQLASQFVNLFIVSWFMVALAGFYRLCLAPVDDSPEASS